MRVPGGAPLAWVWGVRGRGLYHPRLPALWAGFPRPLPTGCWCGGLRAWGPVTNPASRALSSWLCALWGRYEGARGGASCLRVGRPGSGALPPPTACPLGGLPGPTTHWLWVQGDAGVGTRHQPHSARSLELALRAVRAARGRPGGGASCLGMGRPGSGALPPPTARPLGELPGPTTHWLWVRGGAGVGPVTNPTARALASWLCALWGRHEGARGGASCLRVGRPVSGALPPPTACPLGGLPGPTTHWLWVQGGAGVGTRHQPHSARSLELALRAVGAARGRPGRGASCLGLGRPVSGALPPPTARPLGWLPGPPPTGCGCRGLQAWGPVTNPTARASASWLFALWGRHEGARGGAPPAWVWGVRGRALSHPRLPALWAGCRGPLPTGCGCRGVRAWGPVTNPTARALSSWLCALWGRHRGARGRRLLPGCGASGVGRSPAPDCLPSGRSAGAHYPLAVGVAGCGRGDPSPTPQRALLRAGFARCGGGMRVPGGAPPACVWGVRGRALSQPPLPALWACCRGPLPTGCGCRGVRRGDPSPIPQRALFGAGFARCGGGMRVPGGGAPPAWVWGVRGRALSHPRLPALWAGCWGPLRTGCGCGGVRAWGPVTNPTARALASWLCALCGRHEGALGGAPPAWVWGVRGRALSHPRLPALWAGCRGPLPTGCGCGGVRAWGPVTNPTARAHSSWLCALWGRQEGARGGRLLPGCGASGVGRSPDPDCPPPGWAARAHYPLAVGAGGCGRGDPSPTPQRALFGGGFARFGGGTRAPGGGGAPPAWMWGVRGRALCHPRLPALWARCRGPLPTGCGCGGVRAWGPVTNHTGRALLRAGFARCGGGTGAHRGGRLLPGYGASGVGRSPNFDCPPSGQAAGAHYPLAVGAGGCGRGDPSQTPQRAPLRAGFARCGGGMRVPGGAPLAWVWGVRGRALSHP